MSCLASLSWAYQALQLGRAVDYVASLATQRGAFRVSFNLISLCPVSDICAVFSNWVLSSNSGNHPRETTMPRLFGHSTPLIRNLKGVFHAWHFPCCMIYDSWEKYYYSKWYSFIKHYIYIYVCACVVFIYTIYYKYISYVF